MSKAKKMVYLLAFGILFLFILTPFVYVQINKMIYDYRVTNYLIEEAGYDKAELQSVKGVWGIKAPPFYAIVVFKDEPEIEYVYFAHNRVRQFSYRITDEGKQEGMTEADLQHFVPLE